MRQSQDRFLRVTPPLARLVEEMRRLGAEDPDMASRVYATATAKVWREVWVQTTGLRQSSGHACLGRLRDGRCWERWEYRYGESVKERIPCKLPGADHVSLWLKDRKPQVYVSQPYHLEWEQLQALASFGERWDLQIDVEPWPSWHFPSRVLTILVRRQR